MIPFLIQLQPLDRNTNQRTDVYLGSAADATVLGLGGVAWESAIARRPRIAMDLMTPELDGRFQFATADFVIAGSLMRDRDPDRMFWKGAKVWIYRATDVASDRTTLEFHGLVREEDTDLDSGRVTLNLQVDIGRLDKPLLTREFTGGGGLAGEPEMRGVLLPVGFGYNENIDILMFDKINNIAMLDGYQNLQAVHNAFEAGNDLGPSVGDYPTYEALRDAIRNKTVVPGRWATCIAQGLIGYGAPLVGIPTVHATFGSNRTGQIMRRMIEHEGHGAVPIAQVDTTAFASLDIAVNREVRFHTTEQVQVSTQIENMARACNATPLVTPQNKISITRATKGPALLTLNRNGQVEPRVTDWREAAPIDPVYRVVLRGARPGRVMALNEVNYVDQLIDRGVWKADETYRDGNLVWLPDKSQWLYRFATPTSGHAPPTGTLGDQYWIRRQAPTTADNVTYGDGTPIEALKPQEAGANVTEARTAYGIANQGLFATVNSAPYGSPLLTGFGQLSPLNFLNFGSPYFLETASGLIASLSNFKTALGVAFGFKDQGAFATQSYLNLDDRNFFLPGGRFAPLDNGDGNFFAARSIVFGSNDTSYRRLVNLEPQEAGANATEGRTAYGFRNQGALATKNEVNLATGEVVNRFAEYIVYGYNNVVVSDLRPEEAGGNRTESRNAYGFANQGTLSTVSNINSGNVAAYFNFSAFKLDYSITRSDGLTTVTEQMVYTEFGTAFGIRNQGFLATENNVDTPLIRQNAVTRIGSMVGGSGITLTSNWNVLYVQTGGEYVGDDEYGNPIYSNSQQPINVGFSSVPAGSVVMIVANVSAERIAGDDDLARVRCRRQGTGGDTYLNPTWDMRARSGQQLVTFTFVDTPDQDGNYVYLLEAARNGGGSGPRIGTVGIAAILGKR